VRDAAKLREMGVDVVACVATNDQCAPSSHQTLT
jgi:peroxiredoxin